MEIEVCGPHYQPGHITRAFLRVHNITCDKIKIKKDQKIAQIIFEQLNGESDVAYNNELTYAGFEKYSNSYI